MISCCICGKEYMQITGTHLKKHDVTVDEYCRLYPDASIVDDEVSIKLRNHCVEQHKNPEFGFQVNHTINNNRPAWNTGLTKDSDIRVHHLSEALTGKEHTYTHRKNLSIARKHFYETHPEYIPRGEKNGMWGKKLSDEHLKALWTINSSINKPEKAVLKIINQYGFEYVGNRQFWVTFKDSTHKCPDFILKDSKLAVEVFGDYWHKDDDPQVLIDKYNEIGWECLVIWEHEVYTTFCCEIFEKWLGIYEEESFTLEDFNGNWMY